MFLSLLFLWAVRGVNGRMEHVGREVDSDGFQAHIVFADKDKTAIAVGGAPGVFHDVVFLSLAVGYPHDLHAVVVGGLATLKGALALLCADRPDIPLGRGPWGGGLPLSCHALAPSEHLLAGVALPAYGVVAAQCFVDEGHHAVERQVEEGVVVAVVGHLQGESLVVGVMRKTGDGLVFVGTANAVGVFL